MCDLNTRYILVGTVYLAYLNYFHLVPQICVDTVLCFISERQSGFQVIAIAVTVIGHLKPSCYSRSILPSADFLTTCFLFVCFACVYFFCCCFLALVAYMNLLTYLLVLCLYKYMYN